MTAPARLAVLPGLVIYFLTFSKLLAVSNHSLWSNTVATLCVVALDWVVNSFAPTQSTSGYRPDYSSSGVNYNPTFVFDESEDDYLQFTSAPISSATDVHAYYVIDDDDSDGGGNVYANNGPNNGRTYLLSNTASFGAAWRRRNKWISLNLFHCKVFIASFGLFPAGNFEWLSLVPQPRAAGRFGAGAWRLVPAVIRCKVQASSGWKHRLCGHVVKAWTGHNAAVPIIVNRKRVTKEFGSPGEIR